MVLQCYDKDLPIRSMKFNIVNFWVQVHEIHPLGTSDEIGGGFIRVWVTIDISQHFCRGRLITLDDGKEYWVAFEYECLPNLCYWCGRLTYDDKDCEIWINSEGTLQTNVQQFGPWLWAKPFTPSRKNVIMVLGFYARRKKEMQQAKTA